jgi:hypothetical protein
LIIREDTIKNIAAQIKWLEHLNRMKDTKLVKKIIDCNPTGVRTKGRSKYK